MMKLRILYIYPFETYGFPGIISSFIRISNYLNSRKHLLNGTFQEEYLDLRHEGLLKFIPENLVNYRLELKNLLTNLFYRFKFDIVAISCYSSFCYVNTVEVAHFIKKYINPSCLIVVGGTHATICPDDFQSGGFPEFIYETYSEKITPFDYIIKDEGELPFFNLIKDYFNNTLKIRNSVKDNSIILGPELIRDLNKIPLINFELYKKYEEIFAEQKKVHLDFSRGCPFRCKFCPNSTNFIKGYRMVRVKSARKCIEELKIIKNTKWLNIEEVVISDMIFLPQKALRKEFFKRLEKIYKLGEGFPFQITIDDRMETCRREDLKHYKKFNMYLNIGLESCSKILLYRINKILGKSPKYIIKGINKYLKKFKKIIKRANRLDLPVSYYILAGVPGSNEETIRENWEFFLKKRKFRKPLAKKYNINLRFNKYLALIGTKSYKNGEREFGAKIYHKGWWKLFDKHQAYHSMIIDPSKNQKFINSLALNFKYYKEMIKLQSKKRNPFYSLYKFLLIKKENLVNYDLYKKLFIKNVAKPKV